MYTYMYRSYSVEYQVQVKCTTTVVHVCVHTCTGTLPVCTGILCTVHTQVLVGTLHTYLCTFMYPVPAVFYGSTGLGVYTSVYVSLYMHGSTPQRPHLGLWHITAPTHGSSYSLRRMDRFVETLPCGTGVKACTVPVSLDAMALINV